MPATGEGNKIISCPHDLYDNEGNSLLIRDEEEKEKITFSNHVQSTPEKTETEPADANNRQEEESKKEGSLTQKIEEKAGKIKETLKTKIEGDEKTVEKSDS